MTSDKEGLAALLARRARALAEFEAWEASQTAVEPASDVIARIGQLWELLPPSARLPALDHQQEGVRKMHRMLSVLGSRSR